MKKDFFKTTLVVFTLLLLFTTAFTGVTTASAKPGAKKTPPGHSVVTATPNDQQGGTVDTKGNGQGKGQGNGKGQGKGNDKGNDAGETEEPVATLDPNLTPEPNLTPVPMDDETEVVHGKSKKSAKGVVTAVEGNTITMTLKNGKTFTFELTPEMLLKIPSLKPGDDFTFKAGERLIVRTKINPDGTVSVTQVHLIPGKPEKVHRVGTVIAYTPGVSITVQGKDGASTFLLTAGTKLLPTGYGDKITVGSVVTVISPRDPTGGDLTAKGIVLHVPDDEEMEGTPTVTGTPFVETVTPTATMTETPTETPTLTPEVIETEPTATPTETETPTTEPAP